jgi:hypothetical protein
VENNLTQGPREEVYRLESADWLAALADMIGVPVAPEERAPLVLLLERFAQRFARLPYAGDNPPDYLRPELPANDD